MLETERLLLRNLKKSDFKSVHSYASLPDFSQFDVWGPNSEKDTTDFIQLCINQSKKDPRYQFNLAICLQESNELMVGCCSLKKEARRSRVGSLGYSVHPDHQKLGYATEASLALIYFGFHHLDLTVIYATCDVRNKASIKVLENIGMTKTGVIEKHLNIGGELRDCYRYEIYNYED